MSGLEIATSIALGVGLATATGLRVFLPLLLVGVAAFTGHLHVTAGFRWLGTLPAIVILAVAATAEICAYYIPAVDNLLDLIAAPVALIAGVVVSAAVMTDLPPAVRWTTAIIAGGGVAGLTQGATTLLRAKSTAATAGLGNPLLTTLEIVGAVLLTALALLAPFLALIAVVVACMMVLRFVRRFMRRGPHQHTLPPRA